MKLMKHEMSRATVAAMQSASGSNAIASPALVLCFDGPRREDASFLPLSRFPLRCSRARAKKLQLAITPGSSLETTMIRVTVTCASFPSSADFPGWKRRSLLRARRYRSHSLPLSLSLSSGIGFT